MVIAIPCALVSPMKIPPSLCGIREIREIRGQKNQPRITQISRKNHNESHFHSQWRAAGSWKLGGDRGETEPHHQGSKTARFAVLRRCFALEGYLPEVQNVGYLDPST